MTLADAIDRMRRDFAEAKAYALALPAGPERDAWLASLTEWRNSIHAVENGYSTVRSERSRKSLSALLVGRGWS